MPAKKIYVTPEQRAERDRKRFASLHARYGAPQLQALMRWAGSLSDRERLRIVRSAIGMDCDEMLGYMKYLRKNTKQILDAARITKYITRKGHQRHGE